ncbi:multicopper oxidase domain-containing protein [Pedobacter cryophilus]|uniref:Copper oxidase n=1 Tax=Pedobacter cryophilus TaxID=2571271 RepID=A0A4U1C712_9SPHI|nr:multicopper oxidase domain-containing protein [Pedobacter cryophilus]TKB99180.1 copper oxidase [Pedobacter cryophilus]
MKKTIIMMLMICMVQVSFAQQNGNTKPTETQKKEVSYTCPMHPEIHASKPGNCPKCGMKLVVEKTKVKPATSKEKIKMPTKKPAPKTDGMKMDGMDMPTQKSKASDTKEKMKMPMKKADAKMPAHSGDMKMPMDDQTEHSKSMMNMDGMQMDGNNAENIKIAKANLGSIKYKTSKFSPRTVRYDLYVADTTVTFGGKSKRAIAVNGQIPMPTLTFTEGDTALIYVHNKLKEETSLHWHGLFLPNKEDGVPFLTQMPIKAGETYIYNFPIIQHGTHWYHSHSGLQEQIGMYGAFIMNKRAEWDIPTLPLIISEWTNMNPKEVDRSLHAATDWFAIQKGATQSYIEAIKGGHFKTKVANEWKRMTAMDVSDVYYDAFLLNGKNQNEQPQFKAGDKVRLRIANAGASDYFWLKYAGGKITVVATDGNDVEPVEVDRLIIAVSETYDVVVTIPENKSYEFLVTPEDRTKSASLWLGAGEKVAAGAMPRLKYFAGMKMMNEMMDMQGNMIEMEGMKMQNQIMDMNTVMYPEITGAEEIKNSGEGKIMSGMHMNHKKSKSGMQMPNTNSMAGMNMAPESPDIVTLNYNMLRDPNKTTLPEGPWKELKFDLTGNMNRYVWTLDNKTVSESDKILIKKGENLRIIMYNNSMMRHPMHLHGHDFRVINSEGENAPMKNVLDIMPMERDTIEFAATESGDWFFHCHILYHMMSGMGRVFSYENSPPNPEIPNPKLAQRKLNSDDRMFHLMGSVGLESNGSDGELMLANTRYRLSTEWRLGLKSHHGNESETYFGRYIGKMQWLFPFVGFDYHYNSVRDETEKNLFGQLSNQANRKAFVAGFQYILPMMVTAEARLDSKGKVRFQLMREDIPLTSRLRMNLMGNTDKEYMGGLRYIVTKYFSLSTHYDSDMGYGGGLTFTY